MVLINKKECNEFPSDLHADMLEEVQGEVMVADVTSIKGQPSVFPSLF